MNGKPALGRRFHGLDAIRGIAAILVATGHVALLEPINFPEAFLAVDLFFLLSGVVLCDAYGNRLRSGLSWRSFMGLRVIRLYPLYLLGSMVGLVALATAPTASPWPASTLIPLAITMIPVAGSSLYPLDGPAWSLLFEMVAGAVYGNIAKTGTSVMLVTIIVASGFGLIALCTAQPQHSLNIGWTLGSLPGGAVRVAFSFATGILLRHLLDRTSASLAGPATQTTAVCAILAVILAILVARPSAAVRPFMELGAVLVVFPILMFAMLRYEPSGLVRRLSIKLGAISYPLYILHAPVAEIVWHVGVGSRALMPWSGLAFMASLVWVCAWLDRAFDRPVRARLASLHQTLAARAACTESALKTS